MSYHLRVVMICPFYGMNHIEENRQQPHEKDLLHPWFRLNWTRGFEFSVVHERFLTFPHFFKKVLAKKGPLFSDGWGKLLEKFFRFKFLPQVLLEKKGEDRLAFS